METAQMIVDAIEKGADVHTVTASLLFTVLPSEVTREMRVIAKYYNMAVYRQIHQYQTLGE